MENPLYNILALIRGDIHNCWLRKAASATFLHSRIWTDPFVGCPSRVLSFVHLLPREKKEFASMKRKHSENCARCKSFPKTFSHLPWCSQSNLIASYALEKFLHFPFTVLWVKLLIWGLWGHLLKRAFKGSVISCSQDMVFGLWLKSQPLMVV